MNTEKVPNEPPYGPKVTEPIVTQTNDFLQGGARSGGRTFHFLSWGHLRLGYRAAESGGPQRGPSEATAHERGKLATTTWGLLSEKGLLWGQEV